jgi:RNA polymerase sigma factor for flagellar operon FliA
MTSPAETAYQEAHDDGDRIKELVLENMSLVHQVVDGSFRLASDVVSRDDLVGAGMVGLVEAAHRFDPSRGVQFRTFAYYRVKGAMVDFLRQNDWLGKSAREKLQGIREAIGEFRSAEGRKPSVEELADRLEMSVEDVLKYLSYEKWDSISSIDDSVEGEDGAAGALGDMLEADVETPAERAEWRERLERLSAAIRELPEQQQQVIVMYYYEELYMSEMAEVLGVSEGRISQVHTKALYNLTRILEKGQ